MSRAGKLLQRLEHIGEPQVNEQDPRDGDGGDGNGDGSSGKNEGTAAMLQQPQSPQPQLQRSGNNDDGGDAMNIDPQMTNPTSPFSRVTHNTDGSLKADQGDQAISDRGRFVVHRRR